MKESNNIFYLVAGAVSGLVGGVVVLFTFDYLRDSNIFLKQEIFLGGFIHIEGFLAFIGLSAFLALGLIISYTLILKRRFNEASDENQKLKEVSDSKTEFVFFIAHQLRSPLSAVRLSLLMFQDGDLGKLTPEQKKTITEDLKEVDNLLGTIESLLDIPKIEQRQLAFNKKTISLESFLRLIEDLLKDFSLLIKQREISFDYSVPSVQGKVFLEIDWDKIRQTLENLFDNALHYTKNNGQISFSIKLERGFLIFSLADSGIGIPKSEQANLFQKFYRASNARAFSSKGTGIGLYLAKFMVESHGGKIWLESEEDHGATFYFSLPLKANVEEFLKNI